MVVLTKTLSSFLKLLVTIYGIFKMWESVINYHAQFFFYNFWLISFIEHTKILGQIFLICMTDYIEYMTTHNTEM